MPVTEILNRCTRQRNKHLLAISCKNKVWIKSYSARNQRNELLGHLVFKCNPLIFVVCLENEDRRPGEGIFQSPMNFSRYYFLYIKFQEYCLGLLDACIFFFQKILPCTNTFLKCTSPAPAPPIRFLMVRHIYHRCLFFIFMSSTSFPVLFP